MGVRSIDESMAFACRRAALVFDAQEVKSERSPYADAFIVRVTRRDGASYTATVHDDQLAALDQDGINDHMRKVVATCGLFGIPARWPEVEVVSASRTDPDAFCEMPAEERRRIEDEDRARNPQLTSAMFDCTPEQKSALVEFQAAALEAKQAQEHANNAARRYRAAIENLSRAMAPESSSIKE